MRRVPLSERPAVYAGALALAAFLAVLGLRELGALQPLELAVYDRWLAARAAARPADDRVVLVGATEEDIARLGWPASDATLAALIQEIFSQKPSAVGLDIYRDAPRPPGNEAFVELMRAQPDFVAVRKIGTAREQGVAAPPALEGGDKVGFADVAGDPGGIVRRGMLFLDDDKGTQLSFPLRLALRHLAAGGIAPAPGEPDASHLRLGKTTIPPFEANDGGYVGADAGGYQFLLDFAGGAAPFRRYSYAEVLEGKAPKDAFRGKVAIVGVTAPSVKDFFETPFSDNEAAPTVYGITLHGHIVAQLLRMALDGARPLGVVPEYAELAWFALWCVLGAAAGLYVHGLSRFFAVAVAGLALNALFAWALFRYAFWLPLLPQSLGWLGAAALVTAYSLHLERTQRSQLMSIFSRYVAADIANDVWSRRAEFLESGGRPRPQKLVATVLFSDIKGFTAVSEKLEAAGLMEWLNSYMEAMAGLVMKHGGVVDKFIGDAVMAVFGIPVARTSEAEIEGDAQAAARCALAMRDDLARFNAEWAAKGLPAIGIRVGIHTGELISGSLGSSERMEYTVIGDTVNTASRLESFKLAPGETPPGALAEERDGACRILVGDSTAGRLGGKFRLVPVGEVLLKGKEQPVTVYSLAGEIL
jgi:adenylate cyclase